jgi:NAD(P)-dependent dehydrogenase (short-subunit alcohol dehydrogenase family)
VMRLEFRGFWIRVAVIEPGFVGTSMGGKLRTDTEVALSALREEGRRRYGSALEKLTEEISSHTAVGSPPEVIAGSVLHAVTSAKPRTRYPSGAGAKRMLFMRRVLPDRPFDRIILRAGGLEGF